jgi:hypothetical protein
VKAALLALAFVASMLAAPVAVSAQSYEERLWFYPEVPTEQSATKAMVSLAAPTPCHSVEMKDIEVSLDNIYLHIEVIPPAEDTICAQVLKRHTLEQEIGRLEAGLYYVRLYVNGEMKVLSQLNVVESDVAILSTGKYFDEQIGTFIIGEVQNEGDRPLELVQIDITFYLGEGNGWEERTFTTMAVLMPGMTSGFAFPLLDEASLQAEHTLRVDSYKATEPKEQALQLTVEPVYDVSTIRGTVVNNGDRIATQVKIVCAAYDEQGRIIDSVFDYTEPEDIAAGQSADFETPLSRYVENFSISCNSESLEFATSSVQVVPELPLTMIILASSLGGLTFYRLRDKL